MVDEPIDLVKVKCDSTDDLADDEQPRDLSCKRRGDSRLLDLPKDLSLKSAAPRFEPQTAPLDFSSRALAPPPPLFFDLRTKLWQLGAAAGPLTLPWSNESSVCRRSEQKGSASSAASESSKSQESSGQASQGTCCALCSSISVSFFHFGVCPSSRETTLFLVVCSCGEG